MSEYDAQDFELWANPPKEDPAVTAERVAQAEAHIAKLHKELAQTLLDFRSTIRIAAEATSPALDPNGWRAYVYDATAVAASDILERYKDLPLPPFTLHFYPPQLPHQLDGDVKPASCQIETDYADRVTVYFLPSSEATNQQSSLEYVPSNIEGTHPYRSPSIVSNTQTGEIATNHVQSSDRTTVIYLAEGFLTFLNQELVAKMRQQAFHYRVFGNTHQAYTAVEPVYIVNEPKIKS